MTNDLSKKILLIIGLAPVIFEADAATATATVSANIVPASSFSITKNSRQSTPFEKQSDVQRAPINSNRIETGSFNNKSEVIVKIISHHNNIYDLSMSPEYTLTSSYSLNRTKTDHLKAGNNTPSLNSNNEQGLIIEGILTKPGSKNTSLYSGTTEITVNYN